MRFQWACQIFALILCLLSASLATAEGYPYPGQTVQINTHFNTIYGHPIWTLILRDPASGRVLPYQYQFREDDNQDQFDVAFSTAPTYVIQESILQWGPYAVIHNFCHLVDGIINQQSLFITLRGDLSPDPSSFECHISRYNNVPFSVTN